MNPEGSDAKRKRDRWAYRSTNCP